MTSSLAGAVTSGRPRRRVVPASGPLAGTVITGPVPFEHGDSYTIQLVPFKNTLKQILGLLPNIATGLMTPMEHLIIEQHPDHPKNPTILRMQVVTRSPIEETVYFDRPRHERGRVLMGPHADGIGEAFLRVYTDNRMWNSFCLGSTGSGKSRLIETVAVTVRDPSFPPTVIVYIDGQSGASSPFLFKHATWAGGLDDAPGVLTALERIAVWRARENVAYDHQGFTPTEDRPGIMVWIDECHEIFNQAPTRWSNAARKWNKLGMSIHAASQDSNVKNFGNEDVLRSSLLAGTGIAMRVTSRIAGNLVPGLEFDPFDMPILPGYGMMIVPPGGEGRTAGFRGRYSPDEGDRVKAAERGETLPVPTIGDWFERFPARELDRGAARAAGDVYLRRREIAAERRAEVLALVEASDEEYAALTRPAGKPGGAGLRPVAGGGAVVRRLPSAWAVAAPKDAAPVAAVPVAATARGAVLGLPWGRPMTRVQILDELRLAGHAMSESAVDKALRQLVADGLLRRGGGRGAPYQRVPESATLTR